MGRSLGVIPLFPVIDSENNEMDLNVQAVKDFDQVVDVNFANPDTGDMLTYEFAMPL